MQRMILSILILISPVFSQAAPDLPYKLLFPRDGLLSWVDSIMVTGETDRDIQVFVNQQITPVDSTGRFYAPFGLEYGPNSIQIKLQRGLETLVDTVTVERMYLNQLDADSNYVNRNLPDSLFISFGHRQNSRIWGDHLGLRGLTHPQATILHEGDTLEVFPTGAFTRYLEIAPGENAFAFTAILGNEIVYDTLRLTRRTRPEFIPKTTKDINPESTAPYQERWLMAGDVLALGCQAVPGVGVQAKIPGGSRWIDLMEAQPGYYTGSWLVPAGTVLENVFVKYRVKGTLLGVRKSLAPVRVLAEPLGAMTIHPDSRVYDVASDNNLFFPLPDSIQVQVIGLERNMYRIRLSPTRSGYLKRDRVALDPTARLPRPIMLGSMFAQNDSTEWHRFKLYVGNRRIPFEIKERGVPLRIELKLYGAKQGWEWTTYPDSSGEISLIERTQPSDEVWQMTFYAEDEIFWGWYAKYVGNFLEIGIRKAPELDPENPFAGLRILVDPGHGAWERGAVGLTGYAEGDANLQYSRMLVDMLRQAGADARLTRNIDKQMSLAERAEIAREDSCHIFVWAHNNAPGGGRDLMEAKGSSTYYTWPSSKKLCDTVYPHLGNMGIATSGKVSRYYYYMTRQTEYLVYLIEGAFMTHPGEEAFLLTEEGLHTLAQAVYRGLEDFLQRQAQLQQAE